MVFLNHTAPNFYFGPGICQRHRCLSNDICHTVKYEFGWGRNRENHYNVTVYNPSLVQQELATIAEFHKFVIIVGHNRKESTRLSVEIYELITGKPESVLIWGHFAQIIRPISKP